METSQYNIHGISVPDTVAGLPGSFRKSYLLLPTCENIVKNTRLLRNTREQGIDDQAHELCT